MAVIAAQINKGKGKEVEEKGGNMSAVSTAAIFVTMYLLIIK